MLNIRTANLAAFMCALWPPLVIGHTHLWETSLTGLLMAASVLAAVQLHSEERLRAWLAAGLAGGVAVLANPALLPTLMALALCAAWRHHAPVKLCVAAVAVLVVLTPWEVRCCRALRAFVPLRSGMPLELWIGNHVGADGYWYASLHPVGSEAELQRFAQLGEIGYMREKQAAFRTFVREHPWEFISLTARRFARYWLGIPPGGAPTFTPVVVVAALGLWLMRRQRAALLCALPLLLFPLPYYVTHADMRFRFVLDPLMLLLAANAVAWFLAWVADSGEGGVQN